MTLLNIFVSYSSKNRRIVNNFVHDLELMGHRVWIDTHKLSGGEEWWNAILEEIRQCDLFIAALTTRYFKSDACNLELAYAQALDKRILPIGFASINFQTLPSYWQKLQITDYQHGNKEQLLKLVKDLNNLPPTVPLPEPLPDEPATPLSPLTSLRDKIDNLMPNLNEQRLIIANLKDLTEDEDFDLAAWEMLEHLAERDDLLAKPEKELSILLGNKPKNLTIRRRLAALEPRTFEGYLGAVTSVAFSPDAKYVLIGSEDFTAKLLDSVTGETIYKLVGHTNKVTSVAFSPNGEYMLTGCDDGIARLWNVGTGAIVRQFEGHGNSIRSTAFSPDGYFIVTGSEDAKVSLWDIATGNKVRDFNNEHSFILAVAFSPDSQHILAGANNNKAYLWNRESGELEHRLEGHRGSIYSVAVSPNGLFALTGSSDDKALLWDIQTGKARQALIGHTNSIFGVAFASDSNYAVTGCYNHEVKLWDLENNQMIFSKDLGLGESVLGVTFSPDDRYILVGTKGCKGFLFESTIYDL